MEKAIAAIATPFGEGGIGIVRISGLEARGIIDRIFKGKGTNKLENRKLVYGEIINPKTNEVVDEVMTVYMKAPATYTREDVVEINCHGGIVSLKKVLALVLEEGAELAERGEFTKRAFLNGRIDLSQAEAVIDLIKAKTDKTYEVAISQLEGSLSKEIISIREGLLNALVNITVNIDYPDEDIEEIVYEELLRALLKEKGRIQKLLSTFGTGKIIREGLKVAIVGKPNVGKSSLMNVILKENRAIVTDIPGTTRDTILEQVSIGDIPVQLIDTAGIRETDDHIERIGIEKTKEAFNEADLVILVIDGSADLSDEDRSILAMIGERKAIVLLNKADLTLKISKDDIKKENIDVKVIETSMIENNGLELLENEIKEVVYGGEVYQKNSLLITNVRHERLLNESNTFLEDGINLVKIEEPLELIEIDVKRAYELLGEIIGETVSEDIINEVFERFCLGK